VSKPQLRTHPEDRAPEGTQPFREDRGAGRLGWVVFAGVMMMVLGSFNAIQGLVALLNGSWLASEAALPVSVDYTTWGWTWVIVGTVVAIAGGGVFFGQLWARIVGVVFAALNAIGQLLFMPAYPFWSLSILVLDLIVIWALTMHGREVAG
jgi:hypothetical protein